MASVGGNEGDKKSLNFEIILVPFIDLFSVCISFSLLTAVWIHIGSLNVKQAVGGQSQAETGPPPPAVWAIIDDFGNLDLKVKDAKKIPRKYQHTRIIGKEGRVDVDGLNGWIAEVKGAVPELNTALLFPKSKTVYEDIVVVMDKFRGNKVTDLGVSPL